MKYAVFFIALVPLCLLSSTGGNNINQHVVSNYTLEQYLCGDSEVRNNTVITLLPGSIYTIQPGNFCIIESVEEVVIQGNSSDNLSIIQCLRKDNQSRGLAFFSIKVFILKNVKLIGCGDLLPQNVLANINATDSYFQFQKEQASVLVFDKCKVCQIINVLIQNYTGFALIVSNTETSFVMNRIKIYDSYFSTEHQTLVRSLSTVMGSGALIFSRTAAVINITDSSFHNNYAQSVEASSLASSSSCVGEGIVTPSSISANTRHTIPDAGAVTVLFDIQTNISSTSIVNISGTAIKQNSGGCSGAVVVVDHSNPSLGSGSVIFHNCSFSHNSIIQPIAGKWKQYFGSSITVYANTVTAHNPWPLVFPMQEMLVITNSNFTDSTSDISRAYFFDIGHPLVTVLQFPSSLGIPIVLMENLDINTTQRFLFASSFSSTNSVEFRLKDVVAQNPLRELIFQAEVSTLGTGVFTFINTGDVYLSGSSQALCTFQFNIGPVFVFEGSNFYLTGAVSFRNNSAVNGGALYFGVNSFPWLVEPLNATFENNSAMNGGAIFATHGQPQNLICFFRFQTLHLYTIDSIQNMQIALMFSRNVAILAGNSVHADSLYNCITRESSSVDIAPTNITSLYSTIFQFSHQADNGVEEVTSLPEEVCVCDESRMSFDCSQKYYTPDKLIYPGRPFSFYVQSVDDIETPVYAIVSSSLTFNITDANDHHLDWTLGEGQDIIQLRGSNCSLLKYSIYTKSAQVTNGLLRIQPLGRSDFLLTVRIDLVDCPPGFERNNRGSCDCISLLRKNRVKCDVDSGNVTALSDSAWIGTINRNETSEEPSIGFAKSCPSNYCFKITTYNLSNSSIPCRGNRNGILCGKCKKGLSIVVGSNNCQECSHWYLLMFPVYALVGLLIVVMLFVFRLTVSSGTINGLIFYANFVNSFLSQRYNRWSLIFVAFINLDLGFPVCLYHGMNSTHKSYLSFLFPLYLWAIVGGIVLASRYSTKLVKLTSHSAIAVLATVIHLSYEKLLRTSVTGLSFAYVSVENSEGNVTEELVWYYDGNVLYGTPVHLGIVIITTITLVLFILPYTVLLSGIKVFEKLRVANGIRPLIDAYCAPYKDKWRFWFGVRLWILLLNQIFVVSIQNYQKAYILVQVLILIFFTLVQAAIFPYKNIIVNILDLFFLTNAIVLLVFALILDYNSLGYVAAVLVSLVVIVFCCIIAFHVWQILGCWTNEAHRTLPKTENNLCSMYVSNRIMRRKTEYKQMTECVNLDNGNDNSYDSSRLRESFLEDNAIEM